MCRVARSAIQTGQNCRQQTMTVVSALLMLMLQLLRHNSRDALSYKANRLQLLSFKYKQLLSFALRSSAGAVGPGLALLIMWFTCHVPATQQTQTFVYHLHNVGPTSKTLGRRFTNVIQMFCVC